MTERDTTIDALRGAAMIYMVCIIHVVYWFSPTPEPFSSVLLFEMPAVFFIAGAAQSLRRGPLPSMKKMAAGRARRVLLPFAFFLPWLFLWLLLISAVEPADSMFNFSIGSLAWTDYAKILLTFGGDKIPYYQYTWFIPCYFVLLCSFPLQARVARRVGRGFYAVAVLADPEGACISALKPHGVVDAILAKKNLGTHMGMAPAVVAVGPGFTAGVDCHAAVETMRGHTLGRVLYTGSPIPNTGVPGNIGGYTVERVLRAPASGIFKPCLEIGAMVKAGDVAAMVGETPMYCTIDGCLRGLLQEGIEVFEGMKSGDIDPRCKPDHCLCASDKALAVGGGVLEALLHLTRVLEE